MKWNHIIWDESPDGNIDHIDEHGLTIEDVEHVLESFVASDSSHSSGNPCVFGYAPGGEYVIVIYQELDEDSIVPLTAYVVPEPGE